MRFIYIALIYGSTITLIMSRNTIDYFDNDLLKICRPLYRQLDLLFILDGSGSVSGETFATQLEMLNRILEMVEIGPSVTQIAVMQYSSHSRIEFPFGANLDKKSLRDALTRIRHLSGTTKTGKALDKALQIFQHDPSARRRENVAQVAVVVTDGHSHDNPVPAAARLRESGVQILALGIGGHINMKELVQVTGDEALAFQNLNSNESLQLFIDQFKRIAVGEHCDFAKGSNGAEFICSRDSVRITSQTTNRFYGHLFIAGHFADPECVAQTLSNEVSLTIRLSACGVQRQIIQTPRGILFEANVVLKFHPDYSTRHDRIFTMQCFYGEEEGEKEAKKRSDGLKIAGGIAPPLDPANVGIPSKKMPCQYRLKKQTGDCMLEETNVGDELVHSWSCARDAFDTYQSMLVHSCVVLDPVRNTEKMIIDENGCSLDPSIIDTPDYVEPLTAFSHGFAMKIPDTPELRLRCSLRFCDRLVGECDNILPPKCVNRRSAEPVASSLSSNGFVSFNKFRHLSSAFAGEIRPIYEDDIEYAEVRREDRIATVAPLVTFSRRPTTTSLPKPRSIQRVVAFVGGTTTTTTTTTTTLPPATENAFFDPIIAVLNRGRFGAGFDGPAVAQSLENDIDAQINTEVETSRERIITEAIPNQETEATQHPDEEAGTTANPDTETTHNQNEEAGITANPDTETTQNQDEGAEITANPDTETTLNQNEGAEITANPDTETTHNQEEGAETTPDSVTAETLNPEDVQSRSTEMRDAVTTVSPDLPESTSASLPELKGSGSSEANSNLEQVDPIITVEVSTRKAVIDDEVWQVVGLADELMRGMSLHTVEVTSQTVNVYHDLMHQQRGADASSRNQWCKR